MRALLHAACRCTGIAVLLWGWAQAAAYAEPARFLNDYGQVGLMQTPTARSLGQGAIGAGYSSTDPIEGYLLHVQPFEWLQGGFRFVNITNPALATDPSRDDFTDKGVDFQFRLLREGDWLPAVAIGLTDLGGNGLLASEYLVLSRRFFDLDIHFGIGWGRLGGRADVDNPLGVVDDRFETRQFNFEREAGKLSPESWFTGPAALFGGVVWTPAGGPLSLTLEIEGNDYNNERFAQNPLAPETAPDEVRFPADPEVDARVNLGMSYAVGNWGQLAASWQRGNTLGLRFTAVGNFDRMRGPEKVLRPSTPAMPSYRTQVQHGRAKALTPARVERIQRELDDQWISVYAIHAENDLHGIRRVTVWAGQQLGDSLPLLAGRIARTLIRQTGAYYDEFEVVETVGGIEATSVVIPRRAFHRSVMGPAPVEMLASSVRTEAADPAGYREATYRDLLRYPAFTYRLTPSLRSNIGGPENFAFAQLLARLTGTAQLGPRLSLSGGVAVNIADNFGSRLDRDFPSALPKVRSDVRRYLRTGKDYYLSQLEANYFFPIAPDWFGRFSAGIFEDMFGGGASEVLYRPTNGRWAVGLEVAHVWQRDFEQRFGFQDYNTTTGHLTYYHELPFENIRMVLSAGRYLARDVGVTLDFSRGFASGARFGIFASFTNVSAEEFGEGAFDKGFYMSIPFGLFSAKGGTGAAQFSFRPIQRDGGQKVVSGRSLYYSLDASHARSLQTRQADWGR